MMFGYGAVLNDGESDPYTFSALKNGVVYIRAYSILPDGTVLHGSMDPILALKGPDGKIVASNDNAQPGDINPAILDFTLPLTGEYTVMVDGKPGTGSGIYYITMEYIPSITGISIVGGNFQNGRAGETLPLPLTVQVNDDYGPLYGAEVRFSVTTVSGETIEPIAYLSAGGVSGVEMIDVFTDYTGTASVEVTFAQVLGMVIVEAELLFPELPPPSVDKVWFQLASIPSERLRIAIVSGDRQAAYRQETLEYPLIVQVTDEDTGEPVSGVLVSFESKLGSTLFSEIPITNQSGYASARLTLSRWVRYNVTMDPMYNHWVRAFIGDPLYGPSTIFTAASKPRPTKLEIVRGDKQRGVAHEFLEQALVVQLIDEVAKLEVSPELEKHPGLLMPVKIPGVFLRCIPKKEGIRNGYCELEYLVTLKPYYHKLGGGARVLLTARGLPDGTYIHGGQAGTQFMLQQYRDHYVTIYNPDDRSIQALFKEYGTPIPWLEVYYPSRLARDLSKVRGIVGKYAKRPSEPHEDGDDYTQGQLFRGCISTPWGCVGEEDYPGAKLIVKNIGRPQIRQEPAGFFGSKLRRCPGGETECTFKNSIEVNALQITKTPSVPEDPDEESDATIGVFYRLGTKPGPYGVMLAGVIGNKEVLLSPQVRYAFAYDVQACIHRQGAGWYECNPGHIYYPSNTDLDFLGEWDVGGWNLEPREFGKITWSGNVPSHVVEQEERFFTHYFHEGTHQATAHLKDPSGDEVTKEVTIEAVDTGLAIDSGDRQVGQVWNILPKPLVVQLVEAGSACEGGIFNPGCDSQDYSGFPVTFSVIDGDGWLVASSPGFVKTVLTVDGGWASVNFIPKKGGINLVQARVGRNRPVVFEEVAPEVTVLVPLEDQAINGETEFLFELKPTFEELTARGMTYKVEYSIITGGGNFEPSTDSTTPKFTPDQTDDATLMVKYTITSGTQIAEASDFVNFSTVGVKITRFNFIDASIVKANPEEGTFVTEEPMGIPVMIRVVAETGDPATDAQINWTMVDSDPNDNADGGNLIPATSPRVGGVMTYTFNPVNIPPAVDGRGRNVPVGQGWPLSYKIKASITVNGLQAEDEIIITQDNLDELRQEYVDVRINNVRANIMPPAYSFTTTAPADTRVPPNASFEDLVNKGGAGDGLNDGVDEQHDWWILDDLVEHAVALDNAYVGALDISSGYRCPAGNKRVRSPSPNSRHTRGNALDYNQGAGATGSQQNWLVLVTALGLGLRGYVHGSDNIDYWNQLATWPPPANVNYERGHIQW